MMTDFNKSPVPSQNFGPKTHFGSGYNRHHGQVPDLNLEIPHHQEMGIINEMGKQKRQLIHQEGINHFGNKHKNRILEVQGKQNGNVVDEKDFDLEEIKEHFNGLDPEELNDLIMDIPVESQEQIQKFFGENLNDLIDPGLKANLENVDKEELAKQVKQLREMEKKMKGKVLKRRLILRIRGPCCCGRYDQHQKGLCSLFNFVFL